MLSGALLSERAMQDWQRALYYAYGRLDATNGPTILAQEFADAYKQLSRKFYTEHIHYLPAIQKFYEDWAEANGLKEMGN